MYSCFLKSVFSCFYQACIHTFRKRGFTLIIKCAHNLCFVKVCALFTLPERVNLCYVKSVFMLYISLYPCYQQKCEFTLLITADTFAMIKRVNTVTIQFSSSLKVCHKIMIFSVKRIFLVTPIAQTRPVCGKIISLLLFVFFPNLFSRLSRDEGVSAETQTIFNCFWL